MNNATAHPLSSVYTPFYVFVLFKTGKTKYNAKAIDTCKHHSKHTHWLNQTIKTKTCTNSSETISTTSLLQHQKFTYLNKSTCSIKNLNFGIQAKSSTKSYILFILQLLNIEFQVALKSLYIVINIDWFVFLYFTYPLLYFSCWLFHLQLACNQCKYTNSRTQN